MSSVVVMEEILARTVLAINHLLSRLQSDEMRHVAWVVSEDEHLRLVKAMERMVNQGHHKDVNLSCDNLLICGVPVIIRYGELEVGYVVPAEVAT